MAANNTNSLVNIKVGGAGSEANLIENLTAGWAPNMDNAGVQFYMFPLFIPAGTRISATHRAMLTSANVTCRLELVGGGRSYHWTGTGVETLGADTANSRGTSVTAGGAADGAWTSIGTSARSATCGSRATSGRSRSRSSGRSRR